VVEVEVEKERGFKTKRDIEDFGLAQFVNLCKQRVLEFSAVQTAQSIRMGYWMDWNDTEQLRYLKAEMAKNPCQIITVEGRAGPVAGTVEQIVGMLACHSLEVATSLSVMRTTTASGQPSRSATSTAGSTREPM